MPTVLDEIKELCAVRGDHELIKRACKRAIQGKRSHLRVLDSLATCEANYQGGGTLENVEIELGRRFSKHARRSTILLILLAYQSIGHAKEDEETMIWSTTSAGKRNLRKSREDDPLAFQVSSSPSIPLHS